MLLYQEDSQVRIVALANLTAMVDHVTTGPCHRYRIEKVTRTRVYVSYSNPDEYGNDHPMVAVFPCLPAWSRDDPKNVRVVLDVLRVQFDNWRGEGWQAFLPLLDCPKLWRGFDGVWRVDEKVQKEREV